MYSYRLTKKALKQFHKLSPKVRQRIFDKLDYYCDTPNPLIFADPISDKELGNWRFRIGRYRVVFDLVDDYLKILKVGDRNDIYR